MNTHAAMLRRQKRVHQAHKAKPTTTAARAPQTQHEPSAFPNPWQFDTEQLIAELDRARELVLAIPLSNASFGPVNTATATLWELRERLRWIAGEVAARQRAWSRKQPNDREGNAGTRRRDQENGIRKHAATS
jgi:hypothetical protein